MKLSSQRWCLQYLTHIMLVKFPSSLLVSFINTVLGSDEFTHDHCKLREYFQVSQVFYFSCISYYVSNNVVRRYFIHDAIYGYVDYSFLYFGILINALNVFRIRMCILLVHLIFSSEASSVFFITVSGSRIMVVP